MVTNKKFRCKRKKYETEIDAMITLAKLKSRQSKARRCEQRYYWCDDCGGYHLTSKERWA